MLGDGYFARLKRAEDSAYDSWIKPFFVDGEEVVSTYRSIRDGVVFTNRRIIVVDIQGITGKKKRFTSVPYTKITSFSLESAGVFDLDAELDLSVTGLGKIGFEFTGNTNIIEICKLISDLVL